MRENIESQIYELAGDKVRVVLCVGNGPIDDTELGSNKQAVQVSVIVERVSHKKLSDLRILALEQARRLITAEYDRLHDIAVNSR